MPAVPTSQRIVQYIAARVGGIEAMQSTLEAYGNAVNTKPAAKSQLDAAYAKLEEAQQLLIAALSAQVAD